MTAIHGYGTENLQLNGKQATYRYFTNPQADHFRDFRDIAAPKDGIGSFYEVFKEHVYDKEFSPKDGDVVVDVGAYVGMWSVRAAEQVGSKGMVVAVEPVAENISYLVRNTKGLPVVIEPAIMGNRDGFGVLYISGASACHSAVYQQKEKRELKCERLDTMVRRMRLARVDFVKIDAEGAEMAVLEGATEVLKGDVKLSIASYHKGVDGKPEAPRVIEFLKSRGFEVKVDSGLRRYVYAAKE